VTLENGERALLFNEPRAATVVASAPVVTCFRLARNAVRGRATVVVMCDACSYSLHVAAVSVVRISGPGVAPWILLQRVAIGSTACVFDSAGTRRGPCCGVLWPTTRVSVIVCGVIVCRHQLARRVRVVQFREHDTVASLLCDLVIVRDGRIELRQETGVTELRTGDYCGEDALLTDCGCACVVVAVELSSCIILSRSALVDVVGEEVCRMFLCVAAKGCV
jgi:hypothetical protein